LHKYYGNIIQTLYQKSLSTPLSEREAGDLQAARIQWATSEQSLPEKMREVQRIEAEQKKNNYQLQQLLGIDQTPLNSAGQPTKLPKFSGTSLPQIGNLGPMPIDSSAGATIRPATGAPIRYGPPTPVVQQFRDNKTGQMVPFVLKNGKWVRQ